jgi:hypothetical protein
VAQPLLVLKVVIDNQHACGRGGVAPGAHLRKMAQAPPAGDSRGWIL